MKKAMRKMIPAVIMLLISAMLVGTSTYAWFSMNKTVTVTGMAVKARGNDNVTISIDDSTYDFSINETRTGNLKPASSVNGVSFFYTSTSNVNSVNGDAKSNTYVAYNESASQTHTAAGFLGGRCSRISGWTPEARSRICVCRASFLMTFVQSGMPPRLPAQDQCMLSHDISACSAT